MVDDASGYHESRVDGASDDPTEWVPGTVIEPVVERVEAFIWEILGGAVVEVGIELVDDWFESEERIMSKNGSVSWGEIIKPEDWKQTSWEGEDAGDGEDGEL